MATFILSFCDTEVPSFYDAVNMCLGRNMRYCDRKQQYVCILIRTLSPPTLFSFVNNVVLIHHQLQAGST